MTLRPNASAGSAKSQAKTDIASLSLDPDGDGPPSNFSTQIIDLTLNDSDGDSKDGGDDQVYNLIAGNPITARHRAILGSQQEWLNDEIINSYLHILAQTHRDVFAVSSYFHTRFLKEGPKGVQRWLKDFDPASFRLLLIPVNWANTHWALLTFSPQTSSIAYYDSMSVDRAKVSRIMEKYAEFFAGLLQASIQGGDTVRRPANSPLERLADELSSALRMGPNFADKIVCGIPPGQPRQVDGSACGVFLCKWAQVLAESHAAPTPFTPRDVAKHRQAIMVALLTFKDKD